jgi:hypothetical protein
MRLRFQVFQIFRTTGPEATANLPCYKSTHFPTPFPTHFAMSKRKASRPSLDFYHPPDSSDDEPTARHKFLRFEASDSGSISYVTTYHCAPASPVKSQRQPVLAFNDDPIPESDFMPVLMSDGTYVDPAYVDHLGDCMENPLGIKRSRVQSVCNFFFQCFKG